MLIDKVHIPVTKEWIKDVLDVRIGRLGLNIKDLFIITKSVSEATEGDTVLETYYGPIRIFFRNDMPNHKLALMLHTSKYPYPRKGNKYEYPGTQITPRLTESIH